MKRLSVSILIQIGFLFVLNLNGVIAHSPLNINDLFLLTYESADRIQDNQERNRLLVSLVIAQAKSGDISAAIEATKKIKEHASYKHSAIEAIAEVQAQTGDISGALKTIRQFLSEYPPSSYLWKTIGAYQFLSGDVTGAKVSFVKARKSAFRINSDHATNERLYSLARTQVAVGDLKGAQQTIFLIDYPPMPIKSSALAALARKQTEMDDLLAAKETLAKITEEPLKSYSLAAVVEMLVSKRNLVDSFNLAEQIQEGGVRGRTLSLIALGQAAIGLKSHALITLEQALQATLASRIGKDFGLLGIIPGYAGLGRVEVATDLTKYFDDYHLATGPWTKILSDQFRTEGYTRAWQTTQKFQKTNMYTALQLHLASKIAKSGNPYKALQLMNSIESFDDYHDDWRLIQDIAVAFWQTGNVQEAQSILKLVPSQGPVAETWKRFGKNLAKTNNIISALSWIKQFRNPLHKTSVLVGFIRELISIKEQKSPQKSCIFCGYLYYYPR